MKIVLALLLIIAFLMILKIVDTRYIAKATEDMSKTINVSKEENTVEIKQPLKVPLIMQEPELMRGCEVTSLAMILQYNHINVDKMELSKNINHVPFIDEEGIRGNMHEGFVGDIEDLANDGLGVYVEPIIELAKKYVSSERIVNLTGKNIKDLYDQIDKGHPVWVINNSTFQLLDSDRFETWNTKDGDMQVTYDQHSVVITGYDDKYIYINDPLYSEPNRKLNRIDFEKSWEQMGSQAMTIKE
ncbi:C39 family peptidase [Clostridium sp. N37]|uniref:C39 family peptidase n=2 Tax=Clostridium faecium TaxID=2762223 RepID=A0ABR8YV77_9CLOT|nr:C39 family peptidase [Clostridium faecium]